MAEHATIEDAQRHEPKGASSASTGQVLKSIGGGVTTFASLNYTEVTGTPSADAVPNLADDASLTDVVATLNDLLAKLRVAGLLVV